jgi:ABC-type Fe3+ transport system permease subunit
VILMKFDVGIIAAVVGALIFYTRLTLVQRRAARSQASPGQEGRTKPIKNWVFFTLGVVLVCAGAFLTAFKPSPFLETYWWVPVTLGFGSLCFAV